MVLLFGDPAARCGSASAKPEAGSRPDFALNGFLPVGFQTDQKSREKNGDPESVPGLACFDVLCPSNGITGTSTYNIWRLHCVAGDMGLIWVYASKIGKQFIWLFV